MDFAEVVHVAKTAMGRRHYCTWSTRPIVPFSSLVRSGIFRASCLVAPPGSAFVGDSGCCRRHSPRFPHWPPPPQPRLLMMQLVVRTPSARRRSHCHLFLDQLPFRFSSTFVSLITSPHQAVTCSSTVCGRIRRNDRKIGYE